MWAQSLLECVECREKIKKLKTSHNSIGEKLIKTNSLIVLITNISEHLTLLLDP